MFVCFPEPSAFTRFATYAFIGLIQRNERCPFHFSNGR